MDIELEPRSLAKALKRLKGVVPPPTSKKGLPAITDRVVLDAPPGGGITLTATNLYTYAMVPVEGVVAAPGRALVRVHDFLDRAPLLSTMRVKRTEGRIAVEGAGATVLMPYRDAEDFPPAPRLEAGAPERPDGTLPMAFVARAKRLLLPAVCREESRPVMEHVYFRPKDGGLDAAAADGFRLAVVRQAETDVRYPFFLSRRDLAWLPPADYRVTVNTPPQTGIQFTPQRDVPEAPIPTVVKLEGAGMTVYAQSYLGHFPAYWTLVPPGPFMGEVSLLAGELLHAVRLLPEADSGIVRFTFPDKATLALTAWRSEDAERDVEGVVKVRVRGDGASARVAMNRTYLLQMLGAIDREAELRLAISSPQAPVLLAGVDFTWVQMPMMVQW